jgi:hypothetical protein
VWEAQRTKTLALLYLQKVPLRGLITAVQHSQFNETLPEHIFARISANP